MRHPVRVLLLVLMALIIGISAWPAVDPCEHGDPCCQDDCSPDCMAFCCAGLVAVPESFDLNPLQIDLREAPVYACGLGPERALEPLVRPPIGG